LEEIWISLFDLVSDTVTMQQWLEFRRGIEAEYPDKDERLSGYRRTVGDTFYWGPFAYLIGELTIQKNEHYFTMPELVEDICVSFKRRFDLDLPQRFLDSTAPCLVKFVVAGSETSHLIAALRYLYMTRHNQPDFIQNPTYHAKAPIENERIVSIRFLDL
jgi:hypothetical protein